MQVQINLNPPFEYHLGQEIPKFPFKGDLVVAVDPGKTNMAMVVGTPFGTQLCVLQFRAPGRAYDNSEYCHDFKDFLTHYFADCNIICFGIEKAISKKGMNFHVSSMTLTEIRANLIDLAYTLTGKKPLEVNNWSWKYAILPDGMRSQSEKGSARFLPEVFRAYGNADVTDSICIYRYLISHHCTESVIFPNRKEEPLAPYRVYVLPKGSKVAEGARRFNYEPQLSLKDNCTFFSNRTWEKGAALTTVENLTLEDIYTYARGFSQLTSKDPVEVVVVRSS